MVNIVTPKDEVCSDDLETASLDNDCLLYINKGWIGCINFSLFRRILLKTAKKMVLSNIIHDMGDRRLIKIDTLCVTELNLLHADPEESTTGKSQTWYINKKQSYPKRLAVFSSYSGVFRMFWNIIYQQRQHINDLSSFLSAVQYFTLNFIKLETCFDKKKRN